MVDAKQFRNQAERGEALLPVNHFVIFVTALPHHKTSYEVVSAGVLPKGFVHISEQAQKLFFAPREVTLVQGYDVSGLKYLRHCFIQIMVFHISRSL